MISFCPPVSLFFYARFVCLRNLRHCVSVVEWSLTTALRMWPHTIKPESFAYFTTITHEVLSRARKAPSAQLYACPLFSPTALSNFNSAHFLYSFCEEISLLAFCHIAKEFMLCSNLCITSSHLCPSGKPHVYLHLIMRFTGLIVFLCCARSPCYRPPHPSERA